MYTLNFRKNLDRSKKQNEALNKAFEPHQLKFGLLFHNESVPVKLTEEELIQMLLDGEGIYWDLEKTTEAIVRFKPYSPEKVIENLEKKKRLENIKDVFYDFLQGQKQ